MANDPEGAQVGGSPFVQPTVGQGALQDAVAAHPPVALAAAARQMDLLRRDAQGQQMAPAGSRLLPVIQPHPAAFPPPVSPQVRTRCFPASRSPAESDPHCMRFLFIGPPVSPAFLSPVGCPAEVGFG